MSMTSCSVAVPGKGSNRIRLRRMGPKCSTKSVAVQVNWERAIAVAISYSFLKGQMRSLLPLATGEASRMDDPKNCPFQKMGAPVYGSLVAGNETLLPGNG